MSLNVSIIMGRLVADPELKMTANNVAVTSFTVAVDRGYQKAGEERKTDFIDITAWRNTAEFISKWFKKGSMIVIQGELQTRMYEDKNGNKRKAVEIVANNVSFGEAKAKGSSNESNGIDSFIASAAAQGVPVLEEGNFENINDDDLPF